VGHGTRPLTGFLELLKGAGVELVVDVRTAPGSRRHPHFGRGPLEEALRAAGIDYEWRRDLGGWRRARPNSRHTALRADGFRGYADHMETDAFREALAWLARQGAETRTTFMCSESLWWRCHRRMIADALLVAGHEVGHLLEGGRIQPHRLSPAARVHDGVLVYDVDEPGQGRLLEPG
jgi:uncharacterized protein (DUF488 family)